MSWHLPPDAAPEPSGPYQPATWEALYYIACFMRAKDAEEVYNWIGYSDPTRFANELQRLLTQDGHGRVVTYEGKPAAWIGIVEMSGEPDGSGGLFPDGTWQVTMGGTDYLPMVGYYCMAWARWSARETKHNGKILYCDSREGHAEAHKMLLSLGAKCESEPRIGHDGGKYYRFYWRYGENDQGVSGTQAS